MELLGPVIKGEVSAADATAAKSLSLFDGDGNAVTLAATDRFVVTDVMVVAEKAGRVDVFCDSNGNGNVDAGERIAGGMFAANGGIAFSFVTTPIYCKKGVVPKVKAGVAGQVDVIVTGTVLRA